MLMYLLIAIQILPPNSKLWSKYEDSKLLLPVFYYAQWCVSNNFSLDKIDIKSEMSFYFSWKVEIMKWSWNLPQIATKIDNLTFDFFLKSINSLLVVKKHLLEFFRQTLAVSTTYWDQTIHLTGLSKRSKISLWCQL